MGTTKTGMTVAEAVALVNEAIRELEVGPERVQAVDPAEATVDWKARVPASRAGKMRAVLVRVEIKMSRLAHQMPEVLLVADDGAVISFFGGITGTITGIGLA